MARTTLVKTTAKGPYPTLPVAADGLDVTFAAANVADKNQFAPSGNDLILAWNTGATPYTITISSALDPQNRSGDVTTYSIGAGEIAQFLTKNLGWVQTDGYVYLEATNAAVKFAVITLP